MPLSFPLLRPARALSRSALSQAVQGLYARWASRARLRRLADHPRERLLRDIGLTPADLEACLSRAPGASLAERAEARSGNW